MEKNAEIKSYKSEKVIGIMYDDSKRLVNEDALLLKLKKIKILFFHQKRKKNMIIKIIINKPNVFIKDTKNKFVIS